MSERVGGSGSVRELRGRFWAMRPRVDEDRTAESTSATDDTHTHTHLEAVECRDVAVAEVEVPQLRQLQPGHPPQAVVRQQEVPQRAAAAQAVHRVWEKGRGGRQGQQRRHQGGCASGGARVGVAP